MKIRYDLFEDNVKEKITSFFNNNVQSYESGNSVNMMLMKMTYNNKTKLFHDAESPYLTYKNNPRITEFVLHSPNHKIYWRIECKTQETYSNLVSRLFDELDYISELPENKICFIVEGILCQPQILIKFVNKVKAMNLKNKVWIGSINDFDCLLKKQLSA